MQKNEIYKAYGTDFLNMTKRLLAKSGLIEELEKKCELLNKEKSELRITLKPNLVCCNPADYGATTHLEIVEGAIDFLQENGYSDISIKEGSWVGDKTADAYSILGWNSLGKRKNVPVIDLQKDGSFKADCKGMQLNICNEYKNIDFLINCPVLKGHCQTRITCALKNMKGLIPNSEKRHFHTMGLHKPIAHLNTFIHQDFIIIDHICGDPDFEEGGSPLVRNCIMTALDPVLTDAYTAEVLGYNIDQIPYIELAEKLGVGSADLSKLRIITVEGTNSEDLPETRKIMEVNYAVEDVDSCSACYGMLIGALTRLKKEGLLDKLDSKICIGQGYRGKNGAIGVGNCTKLFDFNIPGCPPDEEQIYNALKKKLNA